MTNNTVEEFRKLKFADGRLLGLVMNNGSLRIRFVDWQENEHSLIFDDVCGLEMFYTEGEDLSHATVDINNQFIERSSKISKDDVDGLYCFSFYSAWSDDPLVRIVARSVKFIE
jgi:hypothetical protein